jgi:hypothetical protein
MINDNHFILNRDGRRGIAVYCAVGVLSIVLAIALGVGLLTANRIKMLNEAGHSAIAFSAAQTGIEETLFLQIDYSGYAKTGSLGDASYQINSYACGEFVCVKSVGKYRGTARAVRIKL